MGGKAQTYLEEWIKLRGRKDGRIFQRTLKTGVIMPTGSHKSLRPHSIRWMLDKRCDIARIARCTTHDGRRSFITNMLEAGMAPKVIQGIGSAMSQGTALAMIISAFPSNERGKALGLNLSVVGAGGVLGPIVGGIVAGTLGWRWVFFMSIPVGIVAVLASMMILDKR